MPPGTTIGFKSIREGYLNSIIISNILNIKYKVFSQIIKQLCLVFIEAQSVNLWYDGFN
jgi:hypothetical protein